MNENHEEEQKEYQVVQEKIVPKKKKTMEKFGKNLFHTVLTGAVFGAVAGCMLVLTGKVVIEKFGLQKPFRQVLGVEENRPTSIPMVTQTPEAQLSPVPTLELRVDVTKTPGTPSTSDGDSTDPSKGSVMVTAISEKTIGEAGKTLVNVSAISEGVDWFDEKYETRKNATGLCVGDNGLELLFLVNLDYVEGAKKFEIILQNGRVLPSSIFAYDTNYHLAVLSVPLDRMHEVEEEFYPQTVSIYGGKVSPGTAVFSLGNPNGHRDGVEVGMVTGAQNIVSVIDDGVPYFTTNISRYAEGDGFFFNQEGQVVGMLSTTLNSGETTVMTAAMLSGVRSAAEKMMNSKPRAYCGIYIRELQDNASQKNSLPEGVYVVDVLPGSPALSAGMKNGDIIISASDEPITNARQFNESLNKVGAGNSFRVVVSRETKGERKELSLYITPETRQH